VAALMEKPYYDSILGPTCTAINCESFVYWKYGDRKFYEFEGANFTPGWYFLLVFICDVKDFYGIKMFFINVLEQLIEIKKATFAQILCYTNKNLSLRVPWSALEQPSET